MIADPPIRRTAIDVIACVPDPRPTVDVIAGVASWTVAPSGKTYGTGRSTGWAIDLSTKSPAAPAGLSTNLDGLWMTCGRPGPPPRGSYPPIANISIFARGPVAAARSSE